MTDTNQKIEAARELLIVSKRNLQLIDTQIALLQEERVAVSPADDVSSEHRVAWLGAVDDADPNSPGRFRDFSGISLGDATNLLNFGWNSRKTGTIRNQEDAAFVCTNILCAVAWEADEPFLRVSENAFFDPSADGTPIYPMLRLLDGNTGRSLVTGMTTGTLNTGQTSAPINNDLGAVPFSFFTSPRPGLGLNVKNKLFSEFTIPRGGTVKAEVFNLGDASAAAGTLRAFVSLFGYKVFGG
jgi:hypothetical protein